MALQIPMPTKCKSILQSYVKNIQLITIKGSFKAVNCGPYYNGNRFNRSQNWLILVIEPNMGSKWTSSGHRRDLLSPSNLTRPIGKKT